MNDYHFSAKEVVQFTQNHPLYGVIGYIDSVLTDEKGNPQYTVAIIALASEAGKFDNDVCIAHTTCSGSDIEPMAIAQNKKSGHYMIVPPYIFENAETETDDKPEQPKLDITKQEKPEGDSSGER